MAVEKVQMFTVICDHCKIDIGINQEYSCYNDEISAKENAMNSDWLFHDNKHYCNDCYDYDDNDQIVLTSVRKDLNNC